MTVHSPCDTRATKNVRHPAVASGGFVPRSRLREPRNWLGPGDARSRALTNGYAVYNRARSVGTVRRVLGRSGFLSVIRRLQHRVDPVGQAVVAIVELRRATKIRPRDVGE